MGLEGMEVGAWCLLGYWHTGSSSRGGIHTYIHTYLTYVGRYDDEMMNE